MTNRIARSRMLALFIALITALWAIGSLTSCATADENQIRGIMDQSFELLKNPNEDKLTAALDTASADYAKLSTFGTDVNEFLRHSNAKLEHEIESIAIKDDTATVKLRLTNVDLAACSEAASRQITDNVGSYADILGGENAEAEIMRLFMRAYYDQVDAATETNTELIEVTLKKENGSWKLDDESYKKLVETSMREVRI